MNIIKKLLTKHRKRGRPVVLALLTCMIVVGIATGIVQLNNYLGTVADAKGGVDLLEAFCYETLVDFEKEMEKHFSGDGEKGKYGLDIDPNGGFIQCSGYSCSHCHNIRELDGTRITKSMLKEKCNEADPRSPYRYWFWVKARNYAGGGAALELEDGSITTRGIVDDQVAEALNTSRINKAFTVLSNFGRGDWRSGLSLLSSSLEAPRVQAGSWERWHTEYYYTSTNELDHPVVATSGENCVKCPMGNMEEGGILKDEGTTFSDGRKISAYVVDIKPFYDMMVEDDMLKDYFRERSSLFYFE